MNLTRDTDENQAHFARQFYLFLGLMYLQEQTDGNAMQPPAESSSFHL